MWKIYETEKSYLKSFIIFMFLYFYFNYVYLFCYLL